MANLTGNVKDVTNQAPSTVVSITVKAPGARLGAGNDLIVSSPAEVDFNHDTGELSLTGMTGGLSWLVIEGTGWSDTVALSVAGGMTTLVEAVANAAGVPGIVDYVRLLDALENSVDAIAQGAVNEAIGNTTHVISNGQTTHANKVVRLSDQGKLAIGTGTVTEATDPTNKSYVDGAVAAKADRTHNHNAADIVGNTSTYVNFSTDNRFANHLVKLNSDGKLHISTAGITGLNDPVNKQYTDAAAKDAADEAVAKIGSHMAWWN